MLKHAPRPILSLSKPEIQKMKPLELARAAAKEKGVVRRNPLEKLALKPTSLRYAISAMCYQCEGEDADPGVRQRIATCPVTTCALWNVRPGAKNRAEAHLEAHSDPEVA